MYIQSIYFNTLYNSVTDCKSKDNFYSSLDANDDSIDCSFNIQDVFNAVHSQKKGKAAGPGGLAMELLLLHFLF